MQSAFALLQKLFQPREQGMAVAAEQGLQPGAARCTALLRPSLGAEERCPRARGSRAHGQPHLSGTM